MPILSLIDAVEEKGFTGVSRIVEHRKSRSRGAKLWDTRTPSRPYLQAVLASSWLFQQGCRCFRSQKSQAYYKLLLRKPTCDALDLSAADCAGRLRALEELDGAAPDIPVLAVMPPARPMVVPEDMPEDGDALLVAREGDGAEEDDLAEDGAPPREKSL